MPRIKFDGDLGTTTYQSPISAKFPPFADKKLREMADRSNYLRRAVIRQLKEDGLLTEEEIQQAIALGLL